MKSRYLSPLFSLLLCCFLNREAIPTVVERHIAAKPESQVWTGLNAVSLQSIAQKSIEHRIVRNCGAFAPYFFAFWLFGLLLPKTKKGAWLTLFSDQQRCAHDRCSSMTRSSSDRLSEAHSLQLA